MGETAMPAYKYTLKDEKTTRWYANFYFTDWTGTKSMSARGALRRSARQKNMSAPFWTSRMSPATSCFPIWSKTIWKICLTV